MRFLAFEYYVIGLGSNYGDKIYPRFRIDDNQMQYTVRDNYWMKDQDSDKDSIFVYGEKTYTIELRWSSVDSIVQLLNSLDDTLIERSNLGVMSGGIHIIHAAVGKKKVEFVLHNTFDRTALKITDVTNQYVCEQHRTWATLQDILVVEEFWHSLELLLEKPDSLKRKD